nr:acyltransferase [uncultured Carboxylicivirga sp.]
MNYIKNFLKKLLTKKHKIVDPISSFADVSSSTILINGLKLRFDTFKEDRKYVVIGSNGIISANFIFESEMGLVKIGNNVHIGGVNFISRESITVGNDVTMAWDITIYDHDSHSIYWEHRKNDNNQCYKDYFEYEGNNVINKDWTNVKSSPIKIEDKVWIGFGVTILKGVNIGEGAVVAAKSVVTKNVPPWTVVGGNPARVLKPIEFKEDH